MIALPKKSHPTDLDNYKGICLLQIISRLLARILAKGLTRHLEQKQILATEPWGFRPHRSAVDALFVLSRIMADAGRILDTDPIVIDMMDIKKAYPNCSRNAMDESLKAAGTPEKVRKMMAKLDSGTLYKCRSPTGLSEPYQNMRGTREGCPAAPVEFNVLHHYATNRVRDKWHVQGLAGVGICTFSEEMVWQEVLLRREAR